MGGVKVPTPIFFTLAAGLVLGMVYIHRFTVIPLASHVISNVPGVSVDPAQTRQTAAMTMTSDMPSNRSRRQQLLLITYGRSGSSFTSALIRAHPGVFYFFEPLYRIYLQHSAHEKSGFSVWGENRHEESQALMESFLQCDLHNATDMDNVQNKNSNDTKDTYICLASRSRGWKHLSCFMKMVETCQSRDMTFVKSIRFRVAWAEALLEKYPDFKMLYLLRDPRAVLFSQSKVFKTFDWKNDVSSVSKKHCQALTEDIDHFRRLREKYPTRVKAIRYEDGAMNPQRYAKEIYSFVGLEFSSEAQRLVGTLTSSNNAKKGREQYSVFRKEPELAMRKWRFSAGYKSVSVVDSKCSHLYPVLGYRNVTSQKDLESNVTVVLKPDSEKGIF
ncbi:carbohydrate sulfotransferase 1 isoform X2 [Aplysia californica]|nr:carbohydrate sulfotransferase 1 isoform X2 [Aplysia californica]